MWDLVPCCFVVQLLSCVQLFVTAWTMTRQAPLSSTVFWSLLKFTSIESVMLSNHPLFCHHFFFWLQSFPASGSFPMSWLFASGGQSIEASASALAFPMNTQSRFPLGLTGLSRFSLRDSPEFSPVPQFKSISSSAFSFLHSPILTSILDYL